MIVIIDYDAGNTCSVMNALHRIGADFMLTDDPQLIRSADKVIFPGVGHAGAAMDALRRKKLADPIKELRQPVLGICVGMQLLCAFSEEGSTECLGILPQKVVRFDPVKGHKVPHMGWNSTEFSQDEKIFRKIESPSHFYFVHSYYVPLGKWTIATCEYGLPFSSSVAIDNFTGIQFHAEKSGATGERLIQNFIQGES